MKIKQFKNQLERKLQERISVGKPFALYQMEEEVITSFVKEELEERDIRNLHYYSYSIASRVPGWELKNRNGDWWLVPVKEDWDSIYRDVLSLIGRLSSSLSPEDREDIAQEAMIKIFLLRNRSRNNIYSATRFALLSFLSSQKKEDKKKEMLKQRLLCFYPFRMIPR